MAWLLSKKLLESLPASQELGAACSGDAERQNAVDANSQCEKRMQEPTAIQGENGWECRACGKPVFDGCRHYHGEWQCKRCGEWTYPFHYEPEQGCQACGSRDISYPDLTGLEGWPGHELCGQVPATAALAWRILSTFFPKQNKDNEPEQ